MSLISLPNMETKSQKQPIISQQIISGKSKGKTLFILLGLVFIFEIATAIILLPRFWTKVIEERQQIAGLESETLELNRKLQVLDSLDGDQVALGLNNASLALPTEKKISGIVSSLTSLSSSSGTVVNRLELSPCKISTRSASLNVVKVINTTDCQNVKLDNGVSGIKLSMELLADSLRLQNLIAQLYHVSPMLGVETFEYGKNSNGETSSLTLLLYYQPSTVNLSKLDNLKEISDGENEVLKSLNNQLVILP